MKEIWKGITIEKVTPEPSSVYDMFYDDTLIGRELPIELMLAILILVWWPKLISEQKQIKMKEIWKGISIEKITSESSYVCDIFDVL